MSNHQRGSGSSNGVVADKLRAQDDLRAPSESQAPQAERRLAYLRQIELARRSALESPSPYHQLKSYQAGAPHKSQASRRKDSNELGSRRIPAQSGNDAASTTFPKQKTSFYRPSPIFPRVAFICLGVFLSAIALDVLVVFAVGHPEHILSDYGNMVEGVYQGVNCGFDVKVANPYTCDR